MMKTALASLFAVSLLAAAAGPAAADGGVGAGVHIGNVGVGVGIHAGDHHRRHVCGAWGWRHHARYCRRWYWR